MSDKKTIIFTRNFPYNQGGAENSLLEELLKSKTRISSIYFAEQPNHKYVRGIEQLSSDFVGYNDFTILKRFFYYEYVLNIKNIERKIASLDFDKVVTQNRWAPAVVNAANNLGKESVYFLRDETSLGDINNYYCGLKRLARDVYKAAELPGIYKFNSDNEKALNEATKVIANSNYMAERLWEKYRVQADVIYPKVDFPNLKKSYEQAQYENTISNDGIVLIGDTRIKGVDTFLEIAKCFPNEKFYIFGKNKTFISPLKNVTHMGWSNNTAYPFSRAKVVIVPSIWNEAFGRVAVEANFLDIPVLVSNKGGLPEAVNYEAKFIVDSFDDLKNKLRKYF